MWMQTEMLYRLQAFGQSLMPIIIQLTSGTMQNNFLFYYYSF